jgi:hypothetical protein
MLQTIGLWPAVVVATTLTLGSATVAYREFVPLLEGGTTLSGKLAALSAAPIEPGPSFRSKLLVVDDCAAAMNSFALAALDAEAQTRVFQHCRAVATAIVEEAPTYSYAWYVVALASEAEYDLTAMEQALLQAQTTSPHQEGLAYHRLILAFRHFNDLGQAAQHALASDVTVAARSERGLIWLAKRYLADPDSRALMISAIERTPANVQRRFLSAVNSARS